MIDLKIIGICGAILTAFNALFAANSTDPQAWNKLEVAEINKETPTAFFITYADFASASKPIGADDIKDIYSGYRYKSLNGDWKFNFLDDSANVKDEFFAKNFDDSAWKTIDVPNSWQCRGYDRTFYNNGNHEFFYNKSDNRYKKDFSSPDGKKVSPAGMKPYVPEDHREVGIYRRSFTVPSQWDGMEVFVKFNGVRTGFNLYVNGKFVGYSEDSFTPAEFNITKFLSKGENSIVAEVFKFTTGAYMEMQDMPHTMGIIRDVNLIARPQVYLRDYYAPAMLSENLKKAQIDFNVDVKNLSSKAADAYVLKAFLLTKSGKLMGGKSLFEKTLPSIGCGVQTSVKQSVDVSNFKLWSPDSPNFYCLVLQLCDNNGRVLENIRADYAFRKFEIRKRALYLNGKRFLIKGTNRHDWSPEKAKAQSEELMKKDVELMKLANINAVRTSHYPNDSKFYMFCTRYGLALLDECNLEMHGFIHQPPLDKEHFVAPSVLRMRNMVLRDRNVPSVLMFSLGNESSFYCTIGHRAQAAEARRLDPTRPIHSEPEQGQTDGCADFCSPMYGGVSRMKGYLERKKETRPFFFCEYAHAMGNSIGNLRGKWEMVRANKDCLNGGFIWDWVDQGLYLDRNDGSHKKYISDGRDWNDDKRASAQNFCMNGIIFADRTYSAKYFEVQKIYQDIQIDAIDAPAGKLKITNEFISANLDEFKPIVEVELNGKVIVKKVLDKINLPAGETRDVEIDLPKFDATAVGEYFYTLKFVRSKDTIFAKKGDVVAQNQFFIKNNISTQAVSYMKTPTYEDANGKITVKSGEDKIVIDKKSGNIEEYVLFGRQVLTSPMSFDIDSAFIDNFERGGMHRNFKKMDLDKLAEKDTSFSVSTEGKAVVVKTSRLLANEVGEGFRLNITYLIADVGIIKVSAQVVKINETPESLPLPRIGFKMGVNKEFDNVEYFGKGPFANYSDRKYAANVGRYKSKVNDWFESFSKPQDTGNREDVRWLVLRDKKGSGLMVAANKSPLPMAVLPYSQKEISAAKHPYQLGDSTATELRVAWKVCGVGNAACGPQTRKEFTCDFNGSAEWEFTIKSVYPNFDLQQVYNAISIAGDSTGYVHTDKNLPEPKFAPSLKGKNISKNAKITYSSTDPQWAPKKDTMLTTMEGEYSCHTFDENKPWLMIDLGALKTIYGTKIYNRTNTMSQRALPLLVQVSDDGKNWRTISKIEVLRPSWNVIFKSGVKARYVKLMVDKKSILHLRGVEVFGD